MKLSFFKAWALAAVLCAHQAAFATQAIIDLDHDGLSDTWENQFGFNTDENETTPAQQAGMADPDHDGRTNLEESAAGTDPWSGESSDGFFQAHAGWSQLLANTFSIGWYGVEGKVYQLYGSPDLGANWIAQGEPVEGTGGTIEFNLPLEDVEVANRFFWRLETVALDSDGDGLDDEADLYPLDRFNGARPLLLVAGEWKVKSTNAAGAPVEHVEIEFRKWHSRAQGVEEELLSTGETGGDGCLTFDPEELEAGDRVVARLAGNAQQRVYLPWRPGSEIVDTNPTPGGTGWDSGDLQGSLSNGEGVGGTDPNLEGIPGGGGEPIPPEQEGSMDLYRMSDIVSIESTATLNQWFKIYRHIALGKDNARLEVEASGPDIDVDGSPYTMDYYTQSLAAGPALQKVLNEELDPPIVDESTVDLKFKSTFKSSRSLQVQANYLGRLASVAGGGSLYGPWMASKPQENLALDFDAENSIEFPLHSGLSATVLGGGVGSSRLESKLVVGPMPAHVPADVLFGGEFFFKDFSSLGLQAELPLRKSYSHLSGISPVTYNEVDWEVQILANPQFAKVNFADALDSAGGFVSTAAGAKIDASLDSPAISISISKGGTSMQKGDHFVVGVSAEVDGVALGYFTMPFVYVGTDEERVASDASLRQPSELAGELKGPHDVAAPGATDLKGGQMSQTMEGERKVGLTGLPDPSAATFVDALTKRFHHGELDFNLSIPGSDLALQVSRSSAESIWNRASGLRPNENPLLPFGPGWTSNIGAAAVWSQSMLGATATPGSVQVTTYNGQSYQFTEVHTRSDSPPFALTSAFEPDPTLLPSRENAGVSLTKVGDFLELRQPLLDITQTFEKADLQIDLPGNRDVPADSGKSRLTYYRLKTVTDRFGNTLQWTYNLNGSGAGKIIPDSIHVLGREALKLRFEQENGRVISFWDPSGIKHSYSHDEDPDGSGLTVLLDHSIGGRNVASYSYFSAEEDDPRPLMMRLPLEGEEAPVNEGDFYAIKTFHLALGRIEDGAGNATVVEYELSQVREAYSGRAEEFYPVAGDPMQVEWVDPPGDGRKVYFGGLHRLRPAADSQAADMTVTTTVTDLWGHGWTYAWETPQTLEWTPLTSRQPTASALFFPSLTQSCSALANSQVIYHYDASAGYALREIEDAAGRKSIVKHEVESSGNEHSPYTPPQVAVAGGGTLAVNSRNLEPSSTKDVRNFETHYTYTEGERLPETITDHRGRVTEFVYGGPALPSEIKLWEKRTGEDLEGLLSQTAIAYHPVLKAIPVRVTKEKIGIFAEEDPEWVKPLAQTTQIDAAGIGWPVKTGYDGTDDGDLDDAEDLASEATFSISGRLLEMRSPNGGTRSFAYDASGLLASICYEDGGNVSFEYDRAGRLALTRDPLGHASGTAYDELGRVRKAVRDVKFDGLHRLRLDSTNLTLLGIDQGEDVVQEINYDDENNRVQTKDPRGYCRLAEMDALRRVVKSITPRADREPDEELEEDLNKVDGDDGDAVSTVHYSALHAPGDPGWTLDPMGYKTLYCYDNLGQLTDIRRQYGVESGAPVFQNTNYCYYPDGLPKSVTVTRTPVSASGGIVGVGVGEKLTSEIEYDLLDRPQLLIAGKESSKEIHRRFSYTSTGLPWQVRVRDDIATDHWQISSSVYDALGRVTKQVLDASAGVSEAPEFETIYGTDGSVESVSDAYGNLTSFLYDVLGNTSQTLGPQVRDVRSGLNTRPATSTRYDAAGRTLAVTDPLARTWEYRWDAAGRLRASLGPLMNPGEEDENKRRAVTSYIPSLTGEDEMIDAEGHSTFIAYDATGQVRQTRSPLHSVAPSGTATEEDLVETITRDLMGRVKTTEDGEGHLTRFTYDGFGRLTSRTWDPDEPARQKTESVFYDALLRTGRQDANGQVTSFTYYPESSRLLKVSPVGKPAEELTFDWDDLGRLKSVDAEDGVSGMGNADCAYTYDALGRLKSEVSNGKTMTYGYDLNGLPASITNSQSNRELHLTHDAAGRVTSLQDKLSGFTRTTGFGYDVGGRLLREDLANDLVETSSYDRMGRLTGKQLRTANWNVLCGSRYTYDFNSNVTSLREVTGPLAVPSRTVTMEYDERGRLLQEEQTGAVNRTERHGYDLADNRTWSRKSEGGVNTARDYEYGTAANGYNSNQLAGFDEKVGAASPVTTSYLYDKNGNRTQRSRGGQSDTYVYDSFDRLVEMTLGTAGADNGTYRYAYDHASRRIGREVPGGGKRNFAFAGSSPALEWAPGGPLTEHIGGGVGGRLYSYEDGTPAWDFHDARGDLLGQTGSGGGLFYRALNDAAGRTVADDGDRRGGYGANSKWEEPGGLVNDGFRYRDLDVGVFMGRDPAGFIDGLNVYNYVGHNPWTMYDPFGLDSDGDGLTAPENGGGFVQWYQQALDGALNWGIGQGTGLIVGAAEGQNEVWEGLFGGENPRFSWENGGRKWEWFKDGAREYWGLEISPEVGKKRWEAATEDPGKFAKDFAEGYSNPESFQTPGSDAGSIINKALAWLSLLSRSGAVGPSMPMSPQLAGGGRGLPMAIPGTGSLALPFPPNIFQQSKNEPEKTEEQNRGQSSTSDKETTSPNAAMRDNANVSGNYVHPLSNKTVPTPPGERLPADHFVPKHWIKQQPGFNTLTPGQKRWILNHELNTEGLPPTFNSSKGAKMPGEWRTYKGQPLDPNYIEERTRKGEFMKGFLQGKINNMNGKEDR